MNNEQTPEDKKRRRWVLPVIVVALLAAGGYAAYSVSNPSQNAQTAKTSHKKADNDWFSSSSSTKDKKSSKKAKKGDSDPVAAVLGTGSDDTSIIQDGVDSGLSAILPTDADPISKAVALLGHATNKDLLAQAKEAAEGPNMSSLLASAADTQKDTATGDVQVTPGNGGSTTVDTGSNGNSGTTQPNTDNGSTGTDTPVTPPISGNTNMAPILQVPGAKTIVAGADFDPFDGVKAFDAEDGDLNGGVVIDGKLDTDKPGTYKLTYSISDSQGRQVLASRTITVINTKPTLGNSASNQVVIGADFDVMAGIKANDRQDGDLTAKVTVDGSVDTSKPGDYTLTYTVTDANGETSTLHRKVTVAAEDAEFTGIDDATVEAGTSFDANAGVSVADKYDAANTGFSVDGSVDTSKLGSQELTYTHTDKWEHETSAKRTVTVTADKPVLDANDFSVEQGSDLTLTDHATATSKYGEVEVTAEGDVDTSAPGTYKVSYTATDKYGQTVDKTITVTVQAANE